MTRLIDASEPTKRDLVEWAALAREEVLAAKRATEPGESLADQIFVAQLRRAFDMGRQWPELGALVVGKNRIGME